MFLCYVEILSLFQSKLDFLQIFKVTPKSGQSPCTIVQGLWPDFWATLKIHKKSNFDRNQLKIDKQHKNMYMYQKKV